MLEIKDKEELAEKIQELEEKGDKETLIKRKQVDITQLGSNCKCKCNRSQEITSLLEIEYILKLKYLVLMWNCVIQSQQRKMERGQHLILK